jgi:hypothetical protein
MFRVLLSRLFHKSRTVGDAIENNFHYFYVCPLFIRHRIQLFNSLKKFQDVLNLDILLKGSPILILPNTKKPTPIHIPLYREQDKSPQTKAPLQKAPHNEIIIESYYSFFN